MRAEPTERDQRLRVAMIQPLSDSQSATSVSYALLVLSRSNMASSFNAREEEEW
jgi:hypothetical protein